MLLTTERLVLQTTERLVLLTTERLVLLTTERLVLLTTERLVVQVIDMMESNQVPLILLQVGEEGLRNNTRTLKDKQRQQPMHIFKCFLEQLKPSVNAFWSR